MDADGDSPADHERLIAKIENAEGRRDKEGALWGLIKRKVAETKYPLTQLKIVYANQTKGKSYSEDEDRFLVVELAKYGVGKDDTYERIKRDINEWPAFRFDWFMKSVRCQLISSQRPEADLLRSTSARLRRSVAAARRLRI